MSHLKITTYICTNSLCLFPLGLGMLKLCITSWQD